MDDYKKLEGTHRLSGYQVRYPDWSGSLDIRSPFSAWATGGSLTWYTAYNKSKHDRHGDFEKANFTNLTDAVAGLAALLSAQFGTESFSGGPTLLAAEGINGPAGFESAVGEYLQVKFVDNWPAADRYDFDWRVLKDVANPIDMLTF